MSAQRTKYIFSEWGRIKKRLKGKFIYLFLDYDGTLTPIVEAPGKATLSKKTKELLRLITKISNCKVAIISGRALKDIETRVGLNDIAYVGNHGFEMKGPKIKFKSPVSPRYRIILNRIKGRLRKELSGIKGVIIEDKGFSLCVHYRQVDRKNIPTVRTAFSGVVLSHEVREDVIIRSGKMVLEVKPPVDWDKGKMVLWLLARRRSVLGGKKKVLPIYVGDDLTDEDAFRALKNRGITVFVGSPRKTLAAYYVNNTEETARFLSEVKIAITKS